MCFLIPSLLLRSFSGLRSCLKSQGSLKKTPRVPMPMQMCFLSGQTGGRRSTWVGLPEKCNSFSAQNFHCYKTVCVGWFCKDERRKETPNTPAWHSACMCAQNAVSWVQCSSKMPTRDSGPAKGSHTGSRSSFDQDSDWHKERGRVVLWQGSNSLL